MSVLPLTLTPEIMSPLVGSSISPASFVAAAVHDVLSSLSHHLIFRELPCAPKAKINRSAVTTIDVLLVGALVTCAAALLVFNCHSYIFPSPSAQPTRYSPQLSSDQVDAAVS